MISLVCLQQINLNDNIWWIKHINESNASDIQDVSNLYWVSIITTFVMGVNKLELKSL